MTLKQIAEAFSNGNFEVAYPFLADDVRWNVVGEDEFAGKKAVMENCNQVASYFKSVTTNFRAINVIAENGRVAVTGTAEFIRHGQRVNFVSACDVYGFNDKKELQSIVSYCISDRKQAR